MKYALFILIKNRIDAQVEDFVEGGFYSSVKSLRRKTVLKAMKGSKKVILLTDDESSSTGYRTLVQGNISGIKEVVKGEEIRYDILVEEGEKIKEEIKWTPGPETVRNTPWNGKEVPVRNRKKKRPIAEYKKAVIAYRSKKAIKLNPMKASLIVDKVAAKAAKIGGNPNSAAAESWKDYI